MTFFYHNLANITSNFDDIYNYNIILIFCSPWKALLWWKKSKTEKEREREEETRESEEERLGY